MRIEWAILFLVLPTSGAAPGGKQAKMASEVKVVLKAEGEYRSGSPIPVTVELTNVGRDPLFW